MLNSQPAQENQPKGAQVQTSPEKMIKKKEKEIIVPKKKAKAKETPAPAKKEEEKAEEAKPQAPAQAQASQASGFSGSISVDTARFPYSYYTNLIVRKIGRYWQWSNEFGKLRSVVFFRILKDGSVSEINLKDSSGDKLFDEQALRAVKLAGPFAPLPEGYADNDLGVYFEFTYRE